MKTEEKLKEIIEDIRAKLPRLMQLEKGCWIKQDENIGIIVQDCTNACFVWATNNLTMNHWFKSHLSNKCKIIGKEPTLNDVLEWLNKKLSSTETFQSTELGELTKKEVLMVVLENWNLSKPYLKDQSEQFINFLHGLL